MREPPTLSPPWSAGAPDDEASAPADLTDEALRIDDSIGRHVARKTLRAKNRAATSPSSPATRSTSRSARPSWGSCT